MNEINIHPFYTLTYGPENFTEISRSKTTSDSSVAVVFSISKSRSTYNFLLDSSSH